MSACVCVTSLRVVDTVWTQKSSTCPHAMTSVLALADRPTVLPRSTSFDISPEDVIIVGSLAQLLQHHGPEARRLAAAATMDAEEQAMILRREEEWSRQVHRLWSVDRR